MRLAKVQVSKAALGLFFKQVEGQGYIVKKGIPPGAKLDDFRYDNRTGNYVVTFEHPDFDEVEAGKLIPEIQVEYEVFQFAEVPDVAV